MSRFIDRGAVRAAWVGLGMAVTIGVSFLLVIPIEFLVVPSALFGGMMIGYYANARSDRRGGPWGRVIANALFAGLVTGLTLAVLYLAVKGAVLRRGRRVPGRVLRRPPHLRDRARTASTSGTSRSSRGPAFEAAGITDVDSFTRFYWSDQLSTAGAFLALSLGGSLIGGFMYGVDEPAQARGRRRRRRLAVATRSG